MKCPRCGNAYGLKDYDVQNDHDTGFFNLRLWCNECGTFITAEITQAMINRIWVVADQGFVHDDAKARA